MRIIHRSTHLIVFNIIAVLSCVAALAAFRASTPVVTGVAPNAPTPTATPQRLTINGREFMARLELMVRTPDGGSLHFKESAIQGRTDSSFMVDVPLAAAGSYSLVVTNPDGGISQPFTLKVAAPAGPVPAIDRITPDDIRRSATPQDVKIEGRNFVTGLKAVVIDPAGNEVAGTTMRDVTATTFTLTLKLETAGPHTIVVRNPNGTASNTATMTVRVPVPRE